MATSGFSFRVFVSRFLVALVLVFALTASGIAAGYWYATEKVNDIPEAKIDKKVLRKDEKGKPANFLIIGSDTRAFINDNAEEAEAFGDTPGQRSDVMMIAH